MTPRPEPAPAASHARAASLLRSALGRMGREAARRTVMPEAAHADFRTHLSVDAAAARLHDFLSELLVPAARAAT